MGAKLIQPFQYQIEKLDFWGSSDSTNLQRQQLENCNCKVY